MAADAVTVVVDIAVLGLFKYYGFFAREIRAFLDSLGLGMPLPLLTLALPIGPSVITFQAISYVVDVKRRMISPVSTIDFALYLSARSRGTGRAPAEAARHPGS